VVSTASLNLRIPPNRYEYEGRSHSLWFGDIQQAGNYAWFETAFMISPLIPRRARQNPFALEPGEEAAKAVWQGMAEVQLAWPFTPLVIGELDEFIDRWAGWFADAANGRIAHPSSMPERSTQGSWRRN
jgi:serine/threonine-protein kinase